VGPRAGITHVGATEFVDVATDRGVGPRAVRRPKLRERNAGNHRPMCLRRVEIEALVEVDPNAKSRLVDREERSQPRTEEADHFRIGVRELHRPRLRALTGIERNPRREKRIIGERPEAFPPEPVAELDLVELGDVLRVRTPSNRFAAPDLYIDVADPKAHARLRDAQLARDFGERPPLLAQFTRAGLFFDLASVPHSPIVKAGCDS
jgi:hypothetical protein